MGLLWQDLIFAWYEWGHFGTVNWCPSTYFTVTFSLGSRKFWLLKHFLVVLRFAGISPVSQSLSETSYLHLHPSPGSISRYRIPTCRALVVGCARPFRIALCRRSAICKVHLIYQENCNSFHYIHAVQNVPFLFFCHPRRWMPLRNLLVRTMRRKQNGTTIHTRPTRRYDS